jgi:hypothetical protein
MEVLTKFGIRRRPPHGGPSLSAAAKHHWQPLQPTTKDWTTQPLTMLFWPIAISNGATLKSPWWTAALVRKIWSWTTTGTRRRLPQP